MDLENAKAVGTTKPKNLKECTAYLEDVDNNSRHVLELAKSIYNDLTNQKLQPPKELKKSIETELEDDKIEMVIPNMIEDNFNVASEINKNLNSVGELLIAIGGMIA